MVIDHDEPLLPQAREWIRTLAEVTVIVGAIGAGMVWVTGGFKPQTQVATDMINEHVDLLRKEIADLKTANGTSAKNTDISALSQRAAELQTQINGINDRLGRDELDYALTKQVVGDLKAASQAPIRIPR